MHVDVYKGKYATVNSYVISNGNSLMVIDLQRTSEEAWTLVEFVKSKHVPLQYVFITHGHTDHFTGMPIFQQQFPHARIVVASEEIKRDVKAYADYMAHGGQTGDEPALEPALLPKSRIHRNGFDYDNAIHVLSGNRLTVDGGGVFEIETDYAPGEAEHTATLYNSDLNALFVSDLGYNRVHLWMGDDVTRARIVAWRDDLAKLRRRYAARNPIVYPGHGDPTDVGLFDRMTRYIEDFLCVTAAATSRLEAMRRMEALYPGYEQRDFFLKYSVETHVRATR